MVKALYGLLIVAAVLFLVGVLLYVHSSREAESICRGIVAKIADTNPELSIDVGSYEYSLIGFKPSITDVTISNATTKAIINIDRIDFTIAEDERNIVIKYDIKNISMNDRVIRKGWDVERFMFQRRLFELLGDPESKKLKFDAYGRIEVTNNGRNMFIQNVVSNYSGIKLITSTRLSGVDALSDDFLVAVFGNNEDAFYKTLSIIVNKIDFSRSLVSLEASKPADLYYQIMRVFYSQDRRNATTLLNNSGENIGWNDGFSANEASIIYDIYLKIHDNSGVTVKLSADNDFKISHVLDGLKGDKQQRSKVYEQMGLSASVQ
ncbi:TPA: hypothetical protein ACSCYS_003380 [Aeromonas veronii]